MERREHSGSSAPPQPADHWELEPGEITKRDGAYLPHWTSEGATYAVTFRLADSLPRVALEAFRREREQLFDRARGAKRDLNPHERERLREFHADKIERLLHAGHGECVLSEALAARIVRNALAHFDGQRYDILAWCVMPNHVHVVLRPRGGHELHRILHSWKSFTSNAINRLLGRSGALWQAEYFDHLIRDADDLEKSIRYVLENPHAAGLRDWQWCGTAFQAVAQTHGREARSPSDRSGVEGRDR
jgi:REP element-mobilizing transposase RayT